MTQQTVINADDFYDIMTDAKLVAESDDFESARQIAEAIEILEPFAIGYIATALWEFQNR